MCVRERVCVMLLFSTLHNDNKVESNVFIFLLVKKQIQLVTKAKFYFYLAYIFNLKLS